MKSFSVEHILLLLGTVLFLVLSCVAITKLNRRWQNVMFIIAAVLGAGGIFFRYAMNMQLTADLKIDVLLTQTLQVCNFNFFLLPLMLIPRLEIARQYSVYFSMFAAATVMFSIPSSYASMEWYDPTLLNFWFNHVFAVALPLWMMASGALRPRKDYILKVSVSVLGYFTAVFIISSILFKLGLATVDSCGFSYVWDPRGMPLITQLYELIGIPYVHLLPLIPPLVGFFYLFNYLFERFSRKAKLEQPAKSEETKEPAESESTEQ